MYECHHWQKGNAEGIILLARNEDYQQNNWNKYQVIRHHPEYFVDKAYPNITVNAGTWTLGNGLQVPVPQNQFSYSAMPDAAG